MHRGEPERLRPEEMMNDEDRSSSSSSSSSSSRTSATFATTAAAADVDMEDVPLPCLKWIILNATTNIELSNLSNVSQRWRFVVEQCIMDYAIRDDDNNDGDEKKNRNGNRKPSVSVSVSALPPFSLLLLPSMIRNYFLDQQQQQQQKHRRKEETVTRTEEGKGVAKEDDETYCLCWFHPDGIQSMQLELDQQHTTATTTTTNNNNDNNNLIVMRRHKSHRHHRRCVVDVLYQWNGYSEAIDILKPFGYASRFVQVWYDALLYVALRCSNYLYSTVQYSTVILGRCTCYNEAFLKRRRKKISHWYHSLIAVTCFFLLSFSLFGYRT